MPSNLTDTGITIDYKDHVTLTPITGEPKPAAKEDKEPKHTPEQLQELSQNVMKSLGYERHAAQSKEPDQKKSGEPKGKPEAVAKPSEPPAKEEPNPAAGKEVKQEPAALDAAKLAEDVAQRVTREIKKPEPKPAPETASWEAGDSDAHQLEVLNIMAENKKYATVIDDAKVFWAKEKAYKSTWLAEHPGGTFSPDAEEHSAFYDENEPQYDPNDFERAERKLEVRQEATRIADEREKSWKAGQAWKELQAKAPAEESDNIKGILTEADPELAKEFNGKLESIRADDPAAAKTVKRFAESLGVLTTELDKLFTPALEYLADPKNPTHQQILHAVFQYENEYLAKPEADRVQAGRGFATLEDFNKMSDSEKARHWTIWTQPELVKSLLRRDFGKAAKAEIDEDRQTYREFFKRKGELTEPKPSPATHKAYDAAPSKSLKANDKPAPPNLAGDGEKVDPTKIGASPPPKLGERIVQNLWG